MKCREDEDVAQIIADEKALRLAVKKAARWADKNCGSETVAVCILKGAAFFFCDLLREMTLPVQVEFLSVKSYGDSFKTSGNPRLGDLSFSVEGRNVLIVEDIVDSGYTIQALRTAFGALGAASVKVVALLDKAVCRRVPVQADYACLEVGDEFLVGYGLDYAQRYRTLPYLGVLKPEIYR